MPGSEDVRTRQRPPDLPLRTLPPPGEHLSNWRQFAHGLVTRLSTRLDELREEFIDLELLEEGDLVQQLLDQLEVDKTALQKIEFMCNRIGSFTVLEHYAPYSEAVLILRTRLNQWLLASETLKVLEEEEEVKGHLKYWLEQVKQFETYPEYYPQYIHPDTPLPFSGPH